MSLLRIGTCKTMPPTFEAITGLERGAYGRCSGIHLHGSRRGQFFKNIFKGIFKEGLFSIRVVFYPVVFYKSGTLATGCFLLRRFFKYIFLYIFLFIRIA